MKKVTVLGSGMVSRPAVRTLLETGHAVLVATDQPEVGLGLVDGHPAGEVVEIDAGRPEDLRKVIRAGDLAISLLPVPFHVRAAEACVAERRSFVTTSYVSEEMRALEGEAKRAGVLLLNEIGADPGIDHMQAMRLIDGVEEAGGTVTGLRSLCGGIPAPEASDNPLGYKISWSPRGVVLAGMRPARYLENGEIVHVRPYRIFHAPRPVEIPGIGRLESYPNGDSLRYEDEYQLTELKTLLRGTLRWPGWCETWTALCELGWVDTAPLGSLAGSTLADLMLREAGARPGETPREAAARALELPADHPVLDRLEWLGLFSDLPVPEGSRSCADVLVSRLQGRLQYAPGERDMLVMHHEVECTDLDGRERKILSSMIEYGHPGGDSAMSRTVGLPAAFAARRILDGTIRMVGVRIPTHREIYEPVLRDLAAAGIEEQTRTI